MLVAGTQNYRTKKIRSTAVALIVLGFFVGLPIGNLLGTASVPIRVHLTIAYGSEKASWMAGVQAAFTQWWKQNYPDFPIATDFTAMGSGDSMSEIINEEIQPIIWSPAASIWIPILNSEWGAQAAYRGQTIIKNTTYVIYSPIVIATWQSFLQTYNITGFNSLYDLIQAHPGVVKMAHTDPTQSNSGFMAVIMEISAMLKKDPSQLTMTDLANTTVQNWLRVFESSAVNYGTSTGFLANMMASAGPSQINVAILYENLVKSISNAVPGQKVVAVYPEEGTLFSDHPFCILNASWVTPDDAFVAEKFVEFIKRPDMINLAMQSGFRPINSSIVLNPQIFNYTNYGIQLNVPSYCPQLNVPTSGEVLARVPDLWQLAKSVM